MAVVSIISTTQAATYTWDGGGATDNWSDCANWSTNVCPVAADTVNFTSLSAKNSVIDAGFAGTVAAVNVQATYTGTLSLGRSLSAGSYTQSAGNFVGSSQDMTVSGTFSHTGGTMLAPAILSVGSGFTIGASASFSHNSGIVRFIGTLSATITCNNALFNHVEFAHTNNTKTVSAGCSLPLGNNPTIPRTIVLNGDLVGTGTFTLASNTMTIGATGRLLGFSDQTYAGGLTIQAGANYTAPSGVLTLSGALSISPTAIFSHNNGTVVINGGTVTLACGNAAFNQVRLEHTGTNTKTIGADCTLSLGNSPAVIAGRVTLNGTLTGTGNMSASQTFIIGATGQIDGFTNQTYTGSLTLQAGADYVGPSESLTTNSAFTASGATLDLSGTTTLDANNTFTLNSASVFYAPATLYLAHNVTISSDTTFQASTGTVVFDGTATSAVVCGNAAFNQVRLEYTGTNTKTIGADCTFPLGSDPATIFGRTQLNGTLTGTGTIRPSSAFTFVIGATGKILGFADQLYGTALTIQAGADYTAPSGVLLIPGHLNIAAGVNFAHNNGILELSGNAVASAICGNVSFYSVRITGTATRTIQADCTLPLGDNPVVGSGINLFGKLVGSGTFRMGGPITVSSGADIAGFNSFYADYGPAIGRSITVNSTFVDLSTVESFDGVGLDLYAGASVRLSPATTNFNVDGTGYFRTDATSTIDTNGGTVNVSFSPASSYNYFYIYGNHTFTNLIIDGNETSNNQVFFRGGATTTVLGNLTVTGGSNRLIGMGRGELGDGTAWKIDVQGVASVQRVRLLYSNNISASTLTALSSIDRGYNTNWIIESYVYEGDAIAASGVLGPGDLHSTGAWSPPTASTLNYPTGVAVDEVGKKMFVATCGERIMVYDLNESNLPIDNVADHVLGQADFMSENYRGFDADTVRCASDVVYDPGSRSLFVKQSYRVTVYDLSLGITDGMNASYVLGQSDFTSTSTARSQSVFGSAGWQGLSYDATHRRLFVPEWNRVLVYELSGGISNGMDASYVIGQSNFTSNTYAATRNGLGGVQDVHYDVDRDYLYVADGSNHRVLVYDLSGGISNGMDASYVIGQASFTASDWGKTRTSLNYPTMLAYDSVNNRLFVGDASNYRIMGYDVSELSNGLPAEFVIGASDFTSNVAMDDIGACVALPESVCFVEPGSMYFDESNQRLFLPDAGQNRLVWYDFPTLSVGAVADPPDAAMGSSFTWSVPFQGLRGMRSFSLTSGALPSGLSLDPDTGVISGTPTSQGSYTFTVTYVDMMGSVGELTGSEEFTLDIGSATVDDTPASGVGSDGSGSPGATASHGNSDASGALAQTGVDVRMLAGTGLVMLATGAGMMAVVHRKRLRRLVSYLRSLVKRF